MSKKTTAWAVIRNPSTGMYLIGRRAKCCNNAGQWGFQGGGIDEGESAATACVREFEEEAQVTLAEFDLHLVATSEDGYAKWFEYFGKVRPKVTDEVDEFRWVWSQDLKYYNLHKSVIGYFRALLKQCE